ncbi:hypothetical protein HAX54_035996 [Datura stramonium]|uniref:Uncharacterized protein n=1 Tax=Datura stramonium TaxID=4076 RepID=A0ABS8VK13_DATST|nr:hypothetical protein [Datura stramonium]
MGAVFISSLAYGRLVHPSTAQPRGSKIASPNGTDIDLRFVKAWSIKSPNPKKLVHVGEASSSKAPNIEGNNGVQNINLNKPPVSTNQKETPIEKTKKHVGMIGNSKTALVPANSASPTLEYEEVPLNLVFNTKPHSSSKPTSKSKRGIKRGPVTRGKMKRSMDEIRQDSHQNTLKMHRLLGTTMLEDEVPSSQLVEVDAEVGKDSCRRKKFKSKGNKVMVTEEAAEGPGAIH